MIPNLESIPWQVLVPLDFYLLLLKDDQIFQIIKEGIFFMLCIAKLPLLVENICHIGGGGGYLKYNQSLIKNSAKSYIFI